MLSKKMEKDLNAQINKEFYSEYLYLSMATFAESQGLPGIAGWFKKQAAEEHTHGMKIYNYIFERGGKVVLDQIDKPQTDFDSIKQLFELSLKHEEFVTASINKLVDLAIKESDHASRSFLNWFVDEQVEEEASINAILDRFKYIKEGMIIFLDKELGSR